AVLEHAASRIGGWSLGRYRDLFGAPDVPDDAVAPFASSLKGELDRLPIPTSLAIAALGHTTKSREQQRIEGSFYTDFRLASFVGQQVAHSLTKEGRIVDLAAGSGILLAAAVLAA